jgi:hypothetical protein
MNAFLRLAALLIASRKIINGVYFVVPPVGLLFMYLSPAFNGRERAARTVVTASFLALFMAFGPELQAYVNSEMVRLASR